MFLSDEDALGPSLANRPLSTNVNREAEGAITARTDDQPVKIQTSVQKI